MADYTNSAPATAGNRLLANLIDGLVGGALESVEQSLSEAKHTSKNKHPQSQ